MSTLRGDCAVMRILTDPHTNTHTHADPDQQDGNKEAGKGAQGVRGLRRGSRGNAAS